LEALEKLALMEARLEIDFEYFVDFEVSSFLRLHLQV